jgi:predicted HAD superfamily hydrolase
VQTLSLDVFDTALFRTAQNEVQHLRTIARSAHHALQATLGLHVPPDRLWQTRVLAQRIAYQMVDQATDREDTALQKILALQVLSLGLPDDAARVLTEAELARERAAVRANRRVVDLVDRARTAGKRVVFTSDIYLPADIVQKLLDHHGFRGAYDALYVSATEGRTKRAGGLFDVLLERENVQPGAVVHVGDNYHSDFVMAQSRGISAVWMPRPRWLNHWRRASGFVTRCLNPI